MLEVINDKTLPNSVFDQRQCDIEIEDCLNEYMEDITENMFGQKHNSHRKEEESGNAHEPTYAYDIEGSNHEDLNVQVDKSVYKDFVPPSPVSSTHSLYRPPSTSALSDSDLSDIIPGKAFFLSERVKSPWSGRIPSVHFLL